jgi:hypothetical protein
MKSGEPVANCDFCDADATGSVFYQGLLYAWCAEHHRMYADCVADPSGPKPGRCRHCNAERKQIGPDRPKG